MPISNAAVAASPPRTMLDALIPMAAQLTAPRK
jgi:hypothetical protein